MRRNTQITAGLVVLTLVVFAQVTSHSFLNFDDDQIVAGNAEALKWYPLTWLSHRLDLSLWGLRAGMHALTNVLLHAANAVLLFAAMRCLTRAPWPSAFIAAVFAVHPMHVESVAWISERKDTLSTFFALLALLFYACAPERRLRVALAMAASLASKQMYVTLPFVLLLLDFWPLQRLQSVRDRIVEKLPLFALSAAGIVIAAVGQTKLRAVQEAPSFANAVVAYVRYLGKFFVPIDLAVPYPMQPVSATAAFYAAAVLLIITGCSLLAARRAPYALTGWLWFLGTLVPVIGIVQIGVQSMADRYSYFPYIGLTIAITFAALHLPRKVLAPAGAIVIAVLFALAYRQVGYWKNSETLFTHTIAVTPPNAVAEYNLGQSLELTEPDRAIRHLTRAIELEPRFDVEWYPQAWVGLGTAHLIKARPLLPGPARNQLIEYSIEANRRALELDPATPHAANNIKVAEQMLGR